MEHQRSSDASWRSNYNEQDHTAYDEHSSGRNLQPERNAYSSDQVIPGIKGCADSKGLPPLEDISKQGFSSWKTCARKMMSKWILQYGRLEKVVYTSLLWDSVHPQLRTRCNIINPRDCPTMNVPAFFDHVENRIDILQLDDQKFKNSSLEPTGYTMSHSKKEKRLKEDGDRQKCRRKSGRTSPSAGRLYEQNKNAKFGNEGGTRPVRDNHRMPGHLSSANDRRSPPGNRQSPGRPSSANDRRSPDTCDRCHTTQ